MCTHKFFQAFDRFVAKAGKKRARRTLDLVRQSHVDPVINQWTLVMVGLAMLRDCDNSNVWQASFIAVNMHPNHRLGIEDWMQKICGFVKAADKFDKEVIDLSALLPQSWLVLPLTKRQSWLKMIKDDGESWDVDLVSKLRSADMPLCILANIFRLYYLSKKIANPTTPNVVVIDSPPPATPPTATVVPRNPNTPSSAAKKRNKAT